MGSSKINRILIFVMLFTAMQAIHAEDYNVRIESNGWALVGDLTTPDSQPFSAFALLLHKAAGDRQAYKTMADSLAVRGIASLRIDLRGHGDSVNLGAFDPKIRRYFDENDPAIVRNFELISNADQDIVAILKWLEIDPRFNALPLIVVGSSYTGEEMVEAATNTRFADIYVALAPGSFSEESIAAIDPSAVPWLFVRAEIELPFFPALFKAIQDGSKNAEIWLLPGEGHATDLFDNNPELHLRLIEWITKKLP